MDYLNNNFETEKKEKKPKKITAKDVLIIPKKNKKINKKK
jgi:hypothetical protein